MTFTAADKLKEVTREIAMRRRVYPRWIEAGKMKAPEAERQIQIMEAIEADYREKDAAEAPQQRML